MCTELIKKRKRQEYNYFAPYDKLSNIVHIFNTHFCDYAYKLCDLLSY